MDAALDLKLTEEERQMVLMALGHLSAFKPGLIDFIHGITGKLAGDEMFTTFLGCARKDKELWEYCAIEASIELHAESGGVWTFEGADDLAGKLQKALRRDYIRCYYTAAEKDSAGAGGPIEA